MSDDVQLVQHVDNVSVSEKATATQEQVSAVEIALEIPVLRVKGEASSSVEVVRATESNEGYAKADPYLKKILRGLRKEVKERFVGVYGTKYFHWLPSTYRKKVNLYFTAIEEITLKNGETVEGYKF